MGKMYEYYNYLVNCLMNVIPLLLVKYIYKYLNIYIMIKYKIIKLLGKGNFGQVFEAENIITKKRVALKRIKKEEGSFKNEIKICNYLSNIPGIYNLHWYGSDNIYKYVAFDKLGNSLQSYLNIYKCFLLPTIKIIGLQLIEIFKHLHDTKILHRDVKLDNFLMDITNKKQVYLIDYGLSTLHKKDNLKTHSIIGTPNFISLHIHYKNRYTMRDDLISLCYTLIYCLYGKLPWEHMKSTDMIEEKKNFIVNNKYLNIALTYCNNLKYGECPNYKYIISLLDNLSEYHYFQWNINITDELIN